MFGRKAQEPVDDPVLGPLTRQRGQWRGTVSLTPFGPIPLAIPGSRSGPDHDALVLARSSPEQFDAARAAIAAEINEHRLVYEAACELDHELAPEFAQIVEFDRRLVIEFGYLVPWDEEHTLGARVNEGSLLELSGSTIRC